jgi:hypothetical protein
MLDPVATNRPSALGGRVSREIASDFGSVSPSNFLT